MKKYLLPGEINISSEMSGYIISLDQRQYLYFRYNSEGSGGHKFNITNPYQKNVKTLGSGYIIDVKRYLIHIL